MTTSEVPTKRPEVPQPPPLARTFVRAVVGLGVGVAVGMAPLLGNFGVPFFIPLLSLFPKLLQDVAVPLSAFLMGFIAAGVQFYGTDGLDRAHLRRLFAGTSIAFLLSFLCFVGVWFMGTVRVPFAGDTAHATFVVGFGDRPAVCTPCPSLMSDAECIGVLTFDPAQIESCFGSGAVRRASMVLTLTYIVTMSLFAVLAAVIVLRTGHRTRSAQK